MKTQDLLKSIETTLDDLKAIDIVSMDVHEHTSVTDFMVICCGRSARHVRAMGENLIKDMKAQNHPPISVNGLDSGEWVLVDFADVVVHIMRPETRAYYNLEGLWTAVETSREEARSS